jgi:thiamine phosphate synthase YjbQ (UPF0047 family)
VDAGQIKKKTQSGSFSSPDRDIAATIFAPVATGAVTTIEHESGLISDLKGMLERIAPQNTPGMRTI